mgnify:CR=1 FL=1
MNSNYSKQTLLEKVSTVTKYAFGQEYFSVIANTISQTIEADYIFISKVDISNGKAHPIVSLKHGIPIESISYDLKNTPCLEVIDSCVGYYPTNAQKMFPKDIYFKQININGYIGVSIVPEGQDRPNIIITCLYENEVEKPEKHLEILQYISDSIKNTVKRELLLKENYTLKKITKERSEELNQAQTLLKEIHHRVKNNLQIVSSLLNRQKTKIKDEHSKTIFDECKQQIRAIAFVHDMLYASSDLKTVKTNTFIKALIKNQVNSKFYNIDFDIEDTTITIDNLIPLGLILIECYINTLKHAFTNEHEKNISISLARDNDDIKYIFKDKGKGFPEHEDNATKKSTNLYLIKALTKQISGTLSTYNSNGAVIQINFKDTQS